MDIAAYLHQVRHQYESGHATEHSYRPPLQALFNSIDPALTVGSGKKSAAQSGARLSFGGLFGGFLKDGIKSFV